MSTDSELLRRYAEKSDEAAFAEVVRRQVDFVYSAALRVVNGDAHLAQDVTQGVFVQLACHAGMLAGRETVLGWLHTTARNTAIKAIRGEQRRHAREQEAALMNEPTTTAEINWNDLRPVLDEAVHNLGERDRNAVLLRFFKGLSHQEVGAVLGVSEDTARKRVERALEKLRLHFARRGVTVSSALLVAAITANSVQAAPVNLAARVTGPSLAGAGAAGIGGILLRILYMSTKTKIIVATVIIIGIIATVITIGLQRPDEPHLPTGLLASTGQVVVPTAPAPVAASKPNIPASIATPVIAAVPSKFETASSTPSAVVPIVANPQADLKTAIPDMVRMMRAGDTAAFMRTYMPPDKLDLEAIENVQENQEAALNIGPQEEQLMHQLWEDSARSYEELENQTPTFNAAGDEATYIFTMHHSAPNSPPETPCPLTFIQINGKWYRKDGWTGSVPDASAGSGTETPTDVGTGATFGKGN